MFLVSDENKKKKKIKNIMVKSCLENIYMVINHMRMNWSVIFV